MSFKCKIGLHSWDGCKCSECGKIRDKQHDFSKDCEKCFNCGKINNKALCPICNKELSTWENKPYCYNCYAYADLATGTNLHTYLNNSDKCSKCGKVKIKKHVTKKVPKPKTPSSQISSSNLKDWDLNGINVSPELAGTLTINKLKKLIPDFVILSEDDERYEVVRKDNYKVILYILKKGGLSYAIINGKADVSFLSLNRGSPIEVLLDLGWKIIENINRSGIEAYTFKKMGINAEIQVRINTSDNTINEIHYILKKVLDSSQRPPIEWVYIPAGTFTMGSPDSETGRSNDEIQHQVTLSAFKMSKYQVTFEQYDAFCEATGRNKPKDSGWGRGNRPVIFVYWKDAMDFAKWMECRLPTEAEWEYACRAGTTTPFNTGNDLTFTQARFRNPNLRGEQAWMTDRGTMPVGSFAPNTFGLYDMHGNVSEWCSDLAGEYVRGTQINPKGLVSGENHVARGGGWHTKKEECRSACRQSHPNNWLFSDIGIRLVSL